ncbi:MAG: hypothetical protein GOV01_00635 [Candidatus Altiarchaeota archaeon]|nr:hypothetical protein [Candidatus Altiarchaeota archaeon]
MKYLKAELFTLLVFASLMALFGNPITNAIPVELGKNEIYLAFTLVFTFAVGMEVVK